jgi:uracil-DNA glycosylase
MLESCNKCSIFKNTISEPTSVFIDPDVDIIVVLDYPSIEDSGNIFFEKGSKRTNLIKSIISKSGISSYNISYIPAVKCITKSKSLLNYVTYEYCFENLKSIISDSNVKAIITFGSVPCRLITGKKMKSINDARKNNPYDTIFSGVKSIVTYAPDIMINSQCGGCGKSVYPFLATKDIEGIKGIM